ncbi:hypothetical protein SAMN05444396_106227 [Flavobacterium segetis]|uniref:Uncharacterized protein n=1 Tax=Flavobacterium segetis TaxID=271157 RepID=A0A1M5I8H9_9FLAO|nr:hypothetical protein SAMN05444396_106227 [Flavobacterium segetis]
MLIYSKLKSMIYNHVKIESYRIAPIEAVSFYTASSL